MTGPTNIEVLIDEANYYAKMDLGLNVGALLTNLADALENADAELRHERGAVIDDDTDDAWQASADALGNLGYSLNSHEDTAGWVQQYLFRRSEACVCHEKE